MVNCVFKQTKKWTKTQTKKDFPLHDLHRTLKLNCFLLIKGIPELFSIIGNSCWTVCTKNTCHRKHSKKGLHRMHTSCRWQLYNWFGRNRKSSYLINRNKEKWTHKQSLAWSLHDTLGKLTHASMSPHPVTHAHIFSDSCIIKYTRNRSHVKITHLNLTSTATATLHWQYAVGVHTCTLTSNFAQPKLKVLHCLPLRAWTDNGSKRKYNICTCELRSTASRLDVACAQNQHLFHLVEKPLTVNLKQSTKGEDCSPLDKEVSSTHCPSGKSCSAHRWVFTSGPSFYSQRNPVHAFRLFFPLQDSPDLCLVLLLVLFRQHGHLYRVLSVFVSAQCSASTPAVTGQQMARVDHTVRTDCTGLDLAERVSQTPTQSCSVQTLGSPSEQRNNTVPVLAQELNSFGQDVHISSCPHPPSPSPLGPSLPSQSSLAPSGPSFRTAVPLLCGPDLELQFPSFVAQL